MDKNELFKKFEQMKVIPVVKIDDANDAPPLADAFVKGGLPCAEITFRTAAAADAIKKMALRSDMLVGAGTVLSVDTVKKAVDCGAVFIVAPGFNPKVVEYCVKNGIPVTPGVATPTEIEMGLDLGVDVLKFFPAEAMGGLKTLTAISAPYGKVRFVPTGGIDEKNLPAYLAFAKTLCCGGTWIAKADLINAKAFDQIADITKRAVEIAKAAGVKK
jgi:2-dehydro-3-deoxyphosphogluconate aldolase / (4S)-4-hydroxy-2-oxoglutarate aldolase